MYTELSGTLFRKLSKKIDKNGHVYYHGQLNCNDGSQYVFFFFQPDYNLGIRLEELEANQELTLQGYWGKREPVAFIGRDFYLEEVKEEEVKPENGVFSFNWV